jgi:hypothetical protein
MGVQVMSASATGSATASIAQPQCTADRRRDGSPCSADIEDLAGLRDLDVHARTIASQHAGDVQRNRCAVAQVAADTGSAMLELVFRAHEDQFVAAAECARGMGEVGLRDADRASARSAGRCPGQIRPFCFRTLGRFPRSVG